MYRCKRCHMVVPPRTPATLIVVETRPRHYPASDIKLPKRLKISPEKWKPRSGDGYEMVKELLVCPTCAAAHYQQQEHVQHNTGPLDLTPRPPPPQRKGVPCGKFWDCWGKIQASER